MRFAAAFAVALLVAAPASAKSTVARSHSWMWPASGTITTPFGNTDMGWHPGIDIGMLRSLDVRAAAPGVVTATGYATGFEGYGNIVLVDLGSGVQALYAHLSVVRSRLGEHVVPGELLGIAGCTGSCTGTHLHFEVRLDGTAVNPLRFLPAGIPVAPAGPSYARRIEEAHAARTMLAHVAGVQLTRWLGSRHRPAAAPTPRLARRLAVVRRPFP
jgi:murein DD-endopeptidase MepM/ murein hydrolase activator NlpD